MKKQMRLILFLSLAVLLLVLGAVAACAATPFSTGGQSYATLGEAVNAVTSGGTITVTQNVTIDESVTLSASKTYTITGGKLTFTAATAGYGSNLTISAGNVTLENITIVANSSNAILVAGSSTKLTVKSGTTLQSLGTAASVGASIVAQQATVTIEGGTFYGMISITEKTGPKYIINGGDFYANTAMVSKGSAIRLLSPSRAGTSMTINGGTFHMPDDAPAGSVLLYANADTCNVTINGGTFSGSAVSGHTLLDFRLGTFAIHGGTFSASAPDGQMFYLDATMKAGKKIPSLTITDGTFTVSNTCRIMDVTGTQMQYGQYVVNISGGTFSGISEVAGISLFNFTSGKVAISGGTFATKGGVLFDVTLRKSMGDSFTVTGGTFSLEESAIAGSSALIRTRMAVDLDQLALGNNNDPTAKYYLCDIDILLSGGNFFDRRMSLSPMIDASVGSATVTLNGAAILTRYAKDLIIDVNDAVATDVPFVNHTVTVEYNNSTYYCYRAYTSGNSTYVPTMMNGAYVTITSEYDGIRFASYISSDMVSKLKGKRYTYGTLIAPADYVAAAGAFTHERLSAWATNAGIEIPYVEIVAKNSIQKHEDGSISFNGALVNLNSYTRAYAAVAYIKIGSSYYYSTYSVENNARSMAYISKMAYTTVVDAGYDSLYMPGYFSEYTEAEQKLLQKYSGYTGIKETVTVTPSLNITFGSGVGTNLQNKAASLIEGLRKYGYNTAGASIFVGSKGALATKALAKVEGYGYYIGVIDGTIVIAGSNDALTMQAVGVFADLCRGGAIALTEIVYSNAKMTVLSTETPFVYSHTRDARVYNIYVHGTTAEDEIAKDYSKVSFNSNYTHLYNKDTNNNSIGLDYPLLAAMEIGGTLAGAGFSAGYAFTYVPDSFAITGGAIYIGNTEQTRSVLLAGKDVGYYGYSVKNGSVYIGSYDDATLRLAKAMFLADLADFALDINGDGTVDTYAVPVDYTFKKGSDNGFTGDFNNVSGATGSNNIASELASLITDYPRPSGIALSGAISVSNGELELYYQNAKEKHYKNYCKLLKSKGYTVYAAERAVEGNYFVTYINRSEGIMLYVMYNGYRWASVQGVDDRTDTMLDAMFTPTLRVISAPVEADYGYVHHVLPEELLTKQSYKKLTDSKLTVVQIDPEDSSFGYCYVYTLEDGRFVVLDGGNGHTADLKNFYNVLVELHTEAHGSAPTASNPIKIAAWYISHGHGDHVGLLNKFTANYMPQKTSSWFSTKYTCVVEIESIIGNFPSNDEIYNAHSINQGVLNKMGTDDWYKNVSANGGSSYSEKGKIPFYNVHTGQNFFIGNLEFEVMFTTEDMHPWSMLAFNNGCTVIRLTSHAHDVANGGTVPANATASYKVSNMVLGDIYTRSARVLRATFGPYLESDMVVTGHHGSGGEGELYELINPMVVLWTCRAETVKSYTNPAATSVTALEDLQLINNAQWLYMFSGRALKTYTDTGSKYIYNPTMTITASGIVGLERGANAAEVESNAIDFMNALDNVAGTGTLGYGNGMFSDGSDTYDNSAAVLWRGNYFTDVTLPSDIDWGEIPELPYEPELPTDTGVDSESDIFGDEILLPEVR